MRRGTVHAGAAAAALAARRARRSVAVPARLLKLAMEPSIGVCCAPGETSVKRASHCHARQAGLVAT